MKKFRKLTLASLFTLLMLTSFVSIISSVSATGAGNFAQERIFIPNVQFIAGVKGVNDTINLAIANIGYISATITGCILKDEMGDTVTVIELVSQPVLEKGTFKVITLALNQDTILNGTQYTLTVTTTMGSCFVSPSFDRTFTAEYDPLKDLDLQSKLEESARSTPPPQTTTIYGPTYAPIPNQVIIGSAIASAFSVIGAYKLSQYVVDSKDRKGRFVVFFFTSVIFISIIVWIVSIFCGAMLATM
jgi:hypothetical protein